MSMMTSGEYAQIIEVMKQMALFETKVAELYSICASTWKEDCKFWLDIWRDEISHALYINSIMDIVAKRPQVFEKGRPFDTELIERTVSDISDTIEGVKKGELSRDKVLSIASHLENGFLENRYGEIVKTEDMEYGILMQKIVEDTQKHRDKIVGVAR